MQEDPVDAFFAGIQTAVGRYLFALLAIMAGSAVCYLALATNGDWENLIEWATLLVLLLPFGWSSHGAWFLFGMLVTFVMLASLWGFIQDRSPKLTFFIGFSAAVIYFLPTTFDELLWIRVTVIYAVAAFLYWYLPLWLARRYGEE